MTNYSGNHCNLCGNLLGVCPQSYYDPETKFNITICKQCNDLIRYYKSSSHKIGLICNKPMIQEKICMKYQYCGTCLIANKTLFRRLIKLERLT